MTLAEILGAHRPYGLDCKCGIPINSDNSWALHVESVIVEARLARVQATQEHGTAARYRQGCRCDECRSAVAEYQRSVRRKDRPVPDRVHGTLNGYSNYYCRCDQCKAAQRDGIRKHREKRAEATT